MPIRSKKQFKLMQAVAHDPKVAKRTHISQEDAKELLEETPEGTYKKLPETKSDKESDKKSDKKSDK
jgi:hypothetical protein